MYLILEIHLTICLHWTLTTNVSVSKKEYVLAEESIDYSEYCTTDDRKILSGKAMFTSTF